MAADRSRENSIGPVNYFVLIHFYKIVFLSISSSRARLRVYVCAYVIQHVLLVNVDDCILSATEILIIKQSRRTASNQTSTPLSTPLVGLSKRRLTTPPCRKSYP